MNYLVYEAEAANGVVLAKKKNQKIKKNRKTNHELYDVGLSFSNLDSSYDQITVANCIMLA